MIERYLEDLENRIDDETEERLFSDWLGFWEGRFDGEVFSPGRRKASPPGVNWPTISVNAALDDFDQMALQQLGRCSQALAAGSGELLCVRPNYGTGIIPSLFGAKAFMMDDDLDTLPTSRPLGGIDKLKAVINKGVPDVHSALAGRALRMAERFIAIKKQYPRIGKHVHIYHPDVQGPMDIVELLWGSNLFIDIVDMPGLVKELLELVTETYVSFMRAWQELVPFGNGYAVHWRMLHRGQVMLRDDSAMNFSPGMFAEFIRPYDQRILDQFGGGAIHFCGRGDHYIAKMSRTRGLYAVHLSQPECNDMETIYRNTVDMGIKLIGLSRQVAERALARGRNLHHQVHCW